MGFARASVAAQFHPHTLDLVPPPIVFPMFFSVVDSSSCLIITGCFPRPPSSSPLEYILRPPSPGGDCFLFLILVIVLLLYVHLCIQPPAEIGFICLVHVSLPLYPVVLDIFLEIPLPLLTLPSPTPITFFRIYVVVFTLIVLAFFHRLRCCPYSLFLPLLCRLFGSSLLLPLVFI